MGRLLHPVCAGILAELISSPGMVGARLGVIGMVGRRGRGGWSASALRGAPPRSNLPTMSQYPAFGANPRERKTVLPVKRIGGRLKQALDLMVWGTGERRYLPDNEAAAIAGLNVISIRNALQKPHVLAYYKQQRELLRSRESAANIHRLCEIRDAADNMPAVNAIRVLESLDEEGLMRRSTDLPTPGICIRIVSGPPAQPIDVTPQAKPLPAHSEPSERFFKPLK